MFGSGKTVYWPSNSRNPCSIWARTYSKLNGFFSSVPPVSRTATHLSDAADALGDQGLVAFVEGLIAADEYCRGSLRVENGARLIGKDLDRFLSLNH